MGSLGHHVITRGARGPPELSTPPGGYRPGKEADGGWREARELTWHPEPHSVPVTPCDVL